MWQQPKSVTWIKKNTEISGWNSILQVVIPKLLCKRNGHWHGSESEAVSGTRMPLWPWKIQDPLRQKDVDLEVRVCIGSSDWQY